MLYNSKLKTALIPFDGKMHVRSGKINGSTSFAIDNMYYVNFRIKEQESVPWCGEIQNQRSEVLGKTFNLHSNST